MLGADAAFGSHNGQPVTLETLLQLEAELQERTEQLRAAHAQLDETTRHAQVRNAPE